MCRLLLPLVVQRTVQDRLAVLCCSTNVNLNLVNKALAVVASEVLKCGTGKYGIKKHGKRETRKCSNGFFL